MCNTELLALKDTNTLFRANSLASKSIDHLLKLTSIPYLKATLQTVIVQVGYCIVSVISTEETGYKNIIRTEENVLITGISL